MGMFGGIFYDHLEGSWDIAKGFLREHLEQLDAALSSTWGQVFDTNNEINFTAFGLKDAPVPSYIANTGTHKKPQWDKVDVANGVKGRLKYANLTASANPSTVLGRESGSAGDWEELQTTATIYIDQQVLACDSVAVHSGCGGL